MKAKNRNGTMRKTKLENDIMCQVMPPCLIVLLLRRLLLFVSLSPSSFSLFLFPLFSTSLHRVSCCLPLLLSFIYVSSFSLLLSLVFLFVFLSSFTLFLFPLSSAPFHRVSFCLSLFLSLICFLFSLLLPIKHYVSC